MKDIDIHRGDIYYIQGDGLSMGSEIHDSRPGVVISSDYGNRTANNVIVVYMTAAEKRPMVVHADVTGTSTIHSTAMCEQVYTVSKDRLGRYIRTCTEAEMQGIERALGYSLGLVGGASEPDSGSERVKELEALLESEKAKGCVWQKNIANLEKAMEGKEVAHKEKIAKLEAALKDAEESFEAMREDNAALRAQAKEKEYAASRNAGIEMEKLKTELGVYKGLFERWFAERV